MRQAQLGKPIISTVSAVIAHQQSTGLGSVSLIDAPKNHYPIRPCVINTDPPYYDNIGYADLSPISSTFGYGAR